MISISNVLCSASGSLPLTHSMLSVMFNMLLLEKR